MSVVMAALIGVMQRESRHASPGGICALCRERSSCPGAGPGRGKIRQSGLRKSQIKQTKKVGMALITHRKAADADVPSLLDNFASLAVMLQLLNPLVSRTPRTFKGRNDMIK